MMITLIKETHPESRRVRYSVERDGMFVDGTVTTREDVARRKFEAVRKSDGSTIWEREVLEKATL